jgi:hypothetical protein
MRARCIYEDEGDNCKEKASRDGDREDHVHFYAKATSKRTRIQNQSYTEDQGQPQEER